MANPPATKECSNPQCKKTATLVPHSTLARAFDKFGIPLTSKEKYDCPDHGRLTEL